MIDNRFTDEEIKALRCIAFSNECSCEVCSDCEAYVPLREMLHLYYSS